MRQQRATEVWLVDLDRWNDALSVSERQCPRLSHDEGDQITAIANPAEQVRRRAAYIARRLVIERMFGPSFRGHPFVHGSAGRPELPKVATGGDDGGVSLAHTGRYALIGCCSTGVIGVDIESPRAVTMDARRRDMIIAAASALTAAPLPAGDGARMLQAWVRLEALAKADGRGIGHVLAGIGVVGGGGADAGAATKLMIQSALEVCDLDAGPDLYAAVALSAGTVPPVLFTASCDIERLLS